MELMTLENFRAWFDRQKKETESTAELYEIVESYLTIRRCYLPLFPSENCLGEAIEGGERIRTFQGIRYKWYSTKCPLEAERLVDPLLCVGSTWLFSNDRSFGRPCPDRLAAGLLSVPDTVPAVDVERLGNYYRCIDGNHRIYTAYLLGRRIRIQVIGIHEAIQ